MESHVITDGGRANFYFAETLCSITALRRLYAEKLRILAFRRNAVPLRNDFLILFFYILSGTLILSRVRMFLRTSLTHRHRYILAALKFLSSQLTRQAL